MNLPERCRGCRYWAQNHAKGWDTCDFYLVTNQHRDCPAESCIWFKPKDPEELRERKKPRLRTTKPGRGAGKQQSTIERETVMRRLYDEGLNGREIAEKVGLSPKTVANWRRGAGLLPQSERGNKNEV